MRNLLVNMILVHYSRLRHLLKKSSISLNLKMLAQLSILDKKTFLHIVEEAKSQ